MLVKKVLRLGMITFVAAGLNACADNVHYAKAIQSWQGAPEHALYQAWGNPTSEKKMTHGNRLLTYRVVERENSQKKYSPGFGATRMSPQTNNMLSRPSPMMRHHTETFWCETSFEMNHVGVIVNTHFHGNNCLATKESSKKWSFHH